VYRYGETIEQTLSRADDALYRAKNAGRNRVYEEKPASRPNKVVRLVQRD
jgi:predicted signal transduction protein with EAL and GGDEF domain